MSAKNVAKLKNWHFTSVQWKYNNLINLKSNFGLTIIFNVLLKVMKLPILLIFKNIKMSILYDELP